MNKRSDPDFAKARKMRETAAELDLGATPEHKQWLHTLGKADLPARLHRDQPDVETALKKVGVGYSTKELSAISPLARPTSKQDVVIFTRKGKVVGYSVGATPLNT